MRDGVPALGPSVIAPATDDRPFLYFQGGAIPALYLWTLGRHPADLADRACGRSGGPFRTMRPYADLFFMGAAFLLLETKNIATFALLFGTTWLVNALVFAGVLRDRAGRGRDRPDGSARHRYRWCSPASRCRWRWRTSSSPTGC